MILIFHTIIVTFLFISVSISYRFHYSDLSSKKPTSSVISCCYNCYYISIFFSWVGSLRDAATSTSFSQLISERSCYTSFDVYSERLLSRLLVSNGNTFKMASLIDNYEQQYAVLTADITAKIGRIRTQSGNEKRAFIQDVDRQIEEAQELLEQMELEVRGVNGAARDRLRGRVESHRAELKRLTQEFQLAKKPKDESIEMNREDSWENNITEDQKKRLLDTSERIDRSGRTLQNGYRMVLETEDIGSQVLKELHEQRETIQRGRGRLRDTDAELGRGSRLLSGMIFRSLQQRVVLAAVALTLIIVACIVVYYSFKSKS